MYKLIKPKGNNANVSVENTDTLASIIIGRLSTDILKILKEDEGIEPSNYTDEWSIELTKETANKLSKLAMKMKKPIRAKVEKEPTSEQKKPVKEMDAFDLIFGEM